MFHHYSSQSLDRKTIVEDVKTISKLSMLYDVISRGGGPGGKVKKKKCPLPLGKKKIFFFFFFLGEKRKKLKAKNF